MIICHHISELRQAVAQLKSASKKIGFVPTMGNLHRGHISLVERAAESADAVVVSIFVNPMQFNNAKDLENYPRTLEADLEQLRAANVAAVFIPKAEEMYPLGLDRETTVSVPGLSTCLEGAMRPGHFDGVATVVTKLFNVVQPDLAVFGQKDYQQLALLTKMTADLLLPIEIISLATVRESSGLAMSSRNNRLSDDQKQQAAQIYQTLQSIGKQLQHDNVDALISSHTESLNQQGFVCDAIDIVDAQHLSPLTAESTQAVILLAAYLGEVRLIDNLRVELN